ncbi:MAG: preprotein translocase subunit SecG [Bacilli bacterium]|nr:preprotein translocase subunit SecG [Bacilli bacterium]
MEIVILILALLLIALVLLQSGKAEGGRSPFSGATDSLFANRKERGGELFITRLTYAMGFVFFLLCFLVSL